jgi:hypothetical protein
MSKVLSPTGTWQPLTDLAACTEAVLETPTGRMSCLYVGVILLILPALAHAIVPFLARRLRHRRCPSRRSILHDWDVDVNDIATPVGTMIPRVVAPMCKPAHSLEPTPSF